MELVRKDLVAQKYGGATNLAYNEKIKKMIEEGHSVYHFGFGQSPFPVIELASESLKQHTGQCAYLHVQGLPALRKGICDFHRHYDHVTFDPEDIVVAPGSKELILLVMTVFNGEILLNSPSWTTYKPQAVLSGHCSIMVDSREEDEWRVTPQGLEKAVEDLSSDRYKLLVLCNPCNPSESVQLYPEGAILCSGMSKWAAAGGWRLGYHIYPRELQALRDVVASAGSHTYSCAPAPVQYAFAQVRNTLLSLGQNAAGRARALDRFAEDLIADSLATLQLTPPFVMVKTITTIYLP
ncbi:aspartate aminotransferase-like [Plakobranchus ocellatus]|uniref:Aspartate aminotransferase-like n=1 Tax=Plakobranchus ocellatus TaxID=259542 RepID=A0AAV4AJ51_9GAST|nr:aspartate aminotransferase-like [Plakobranchus ocellatus]